MLTSYQRLTERFLEIESLKDAISILNWDEAVMMPVGSGESRNRTVAELNSMAQSLTIAADVGEWISDAMDRSSHLSEWERANLREMKRIHRISTAVPVELNHKLVLARMNCEQKWRALRAKNNWLEFMPYLSEVLELTRESLQSLSDATGLALYDAALSLYSPGLTTASVESLFAEIKGFLPELLGRVLEKQKSEKVLIPEGPFPMAAQKALGAELMGTIGFDFHRGRLDESHHPFCGGTRTDVRITTRYNEHDFIPALMGVLHETGHAVYEQNLPASWLGQPVGASAGMAIHESQSLTMEMQVCRSHEFMAFAEPYIRKHLGSHTRNPESLSATNLGLLVSRVRPGFIRVDADEVTYPMHVILRFEIERDLLHGSLPLKDLPAEWDRRMRNYLNLSTQGNDRDGCMQDVHWPSGAFGYFPAYTFGAVIAAQLFEKLSETYPAARSKMAEGDFSDVQAWLSQNVWSQGSLKTTMELVESAAGPLSAAAFQRHLIKRYQEGN